MPAFSAAATRPKVCVTRPALGRTHAQKNAVASGLLASVAAVTLVAAPAQAGILDNLSSNPAQDVKGSILKGEEKAKESVPSPPPKSQAPKPVANVEEATDEATAPSRKAALAVPEQEEGARKFKGKGRPDVRDRFQSGGSGGKGPEAGKPRGQVTLGPQSGSPGA